MPTTNHNEKNLEEISDLESEEIINSKPVFFIGSYISVYSPTNLPNGQSFCKEMYEYIFDEDKSVNSFLFKEFSDIPFEALMEMSPNKNNSLNGILNLYSTETYNDLHKLLAENLIKKQISAIITPDYDLTFDILLKNEDISIVKTENDHLKNITQRDRGIYFKIHGSAEPDHKETIIYTLSQEGELLEWKDQLLNELIRNKTIIFIGYSGRDFDICPVISYKHSYDRIIWLHKGIKESLSPYALQLIESSGSNQLIFGDLGEFLNKLFKCNISTKIDSFSITPSSLFKLTKKEIIQWRLSILDRLAYANIGLQMLEFYRKDLDDLFYQQLKGSFYGHSGLYKKASIICVEIAKSEKTPFLDRVKSWIYAAGYINTYGNYFLAWNYVNEAEKLFETQQYNQELALMILRMKFTFLMRSHQIYTALHLTFLKSRIKTKASVIYKKLYSQLIKTGFWNERQIVQHMAERIGIESIIPALALSSDLGYSNLGMPSMDIIKFKDTIRYGNEVQCQCSLEKSNGYIHKAETLGVDTEVWKISRLKVKKQKLHLYEKFSYIDKWWFNLRKPEYIPMLKLIYLLDLCITYIGLLFKKMFNQ